jgi:hypothetical protein
MDLEQRIVERIAREFLPAEQSEVAALLGTYSGIEGGRVAWDILELSKGKVESVRSYVESALRDYRDVLYWAEYYENDPLLRGRDPRQMVNDILDKWGEKKKPE